MWHTSVDHHSILSQSSAAACQLLLSCDAHLTQWNTAQSNQMQDWMKLSSHSEHLYDISPQWTPICVYCLVVQSDTKCLVTHTTFVWFLFTVDSYVTVQTVRPLSHMWHLYSFSPVWILMCFRISSVWKFIPSQGLIFSAVQGHSS